MGGFRFFILQLAFVCASGLLHAQAVDIDSPLRPSIEDVWSEHSSYVQPVNIPISGDRLNFAHFRQALADGTPQLIANLEMAYPDATYAFLGRDTQVIADIVEAFYLSIGQEGRVVRIGTSKPTLANLNDQQVLIYLKNFGFDFERIEEGKPFILVDTISSGGQFFGFANMNGRQGRHILNAVYNEWIRAGKKPKDLLKNFTMVGLQVSTFKTNDPLNRQLYENISQYKTIRQKNKDMLDPDNRPNYQNAGFQLILALIPDTRMVFNESGYDHYTGAWHEKFNPPIATRDGQLLQNPGPLKELNLRQSVVWLQHQIIDIVNDESFRLRVQQEAQARDVKIELNPPICRLLFLR